MNIVLSKATFLIQATMHTFHCIMCNFWQILKKKLSSS